MAVSVDTAIDAMFEAASLPQLLPEALDQLARAFNARGALLNRVAPKFSIIHSKGIDESVGHFFAQGWDKSDLRSIRAIEKWIVTSFFCDQDLVTAQEADGLPYYEKFARAADVPWFAAAALFDPRRDLIAVSLQRTAKQGAFTKKEIAALNAALPRLSRAAALMRRVTSERTRGMVDGLDLVNGAAVLLGDSGMALHMNGAAERLMGDGIARRGKFLYATHAAAQPTLSALIASAILPAPPHARPVAPAARLPRSSGAPLIAQAVPIEGQAQDVFGAGRAILMLTEFDAGRLPSEALLGVAFGLTPTEARIARLLVAGLDINTIARQLGNTDGTVRFHVKAIFAKSGVKRQAAFVGLASMLLAVGD